MRHLRRPALSVTNAPPVGWYRLLEGTVIETVLDESPRWELCRAGELSGDDVGLRPRRRSRADSCRITVPRGRETRDRAQSDPLGGRLPSSRGAERPEAYRLDQVPGLNQVGDTALQDQVNHHYWQAFGMSAAVGALAGLTLAQSRTGLDVTGADAYRQGVTTNLGQSSEHLLERYLNQMPTITIREGHRVRVYLTADLDLPAYTEQEPTTPRHRRRSTDMYRLALLCVVVAALCLPSCHACSSSAGKSSSSPPRRDAMPPNLKPDYGKALEAAQEGWGFTRRPGDCKPGTGPASAGGHPERFNATRPPCRTDRPVQERIDALQGKAGRP